MKRNSLDLTAICFAWILLWALLKSPKRFLTDVCVCVCFSMYCWLVVWNHRILCSIIMGIIIPADELHHFSEELKPATRLQKVTIKLYH